MSLSYRGRKIIPAPLLTLGKSYHRTEDGSKLGTSYEIALNGSLLPFRGSPSGHYPNVSGAFWTLGGYPPDEPYQSDNEDFNSLLRKQEALRWLFSEDGHSLEWQPANGQPVVKCNPRVLDVNFPEGNWAGKCDYTVRLSADLIYINGTVGFEDAQSTDLVTSASEDWSFEEIEGWNGSGYRVTHTISANGIVGYDETGAKIRDYDGWQNAKRFVDARTTGTVEPAMMLAAIGHDNWYGGSYQKNANAGKLDGTYAVTETWTICPSPTFTEKTFNADYDLISDEYRVRYEGTIRALVGGKHTGSPEARDLARSAIPSASAARTEAIAATNGVLNGKSLSVSPDVRSIALNQKDGTATFVFEWSTSPNANFTESYEATLSYSVDTGFYTLTLVAAIQGKGETGAVRLANAKAGIPSDAAALPKALVIIAAMLPAGVTIGSTHKSKTTAINERQGSINVSWVWDSAPDHDLDVNVQINDRVPVAAVIPIPGRAEGPIVQPMNTVTEKTALVSIRARNYTTKPSSAEMRSLADSYLGIGGFLLQADSENWNPITRQYERTIRYLILEGY